MSPDRLGTALRDLADNVEEGVAPPVADDLWAGGRRRRRTARLAPLLAAACVAALLALLVWPTGAPRASVPAVQPDGTVRLTTYPSAIPLPYHLDTTPAPGVTAAFVPVFDMSDGYAVSPAGVVTELRMPPDENILGTSPVLSPDGRWLARGPIITDLMTGAAVSTPQEQAELGRTWMPGHDSWWSPDSRSVFYAAVTQGEPKSSGLVVTTDGSMTEAPLLPGGQISIICGWLDAETVLAFVNIGSGTTVLQGRTWRVGDSAWQVTQATIPWPPSDLVGTASSTYVRASLSPDRTRLLMTVALTDPDINADWSTRAMMFDPTTGAQIGMPEEGGGVDAQSWGPGSFVEWEGWGCRPAWREGLPVITDGGVRAFVDTDPGGVIDGTESTELVAISGRYDDPCVAFAGDELRGTPVADTWAVWQERLFVWSGLLVLAGLLVVVVRWVRRQRRWSGPDSSLRPIFPGRV